MVGKVVGAMDVKFVHIVVGSGPGSIAAVNDAPRHAYFWAFAAILGAITEDDAEALNTEHKKWCVVATCTEGELVHDDAVWRYRRIPFPWIACCAMMGDPAAFEEVKEVAPQLTIFRGNLVAP